MKFQFLGTAAGEQYPGMWCRCDNCTRARKIGGRNIRKNSCAFISPNILLDMPPEAFMQAERFGVDLTGLEYLLVTHSHDDHFNLFPFGWRYLDSRISLPPPANAIGARFTPLKTLHVAGNHLVCRLLDDLLIKKAKFSYEECAMEVHLVEPFKKCVLGGMEILPLRANHLENNAEKDALNYVVFLNGRTILYALDTGWFLPETYEAIKQFRYDLVVLEGTFGYGAESETHFNCRKLEKAVQLFKDDGLMKENSNFCVSHVCPHFFPIHDDIAPALAQKGIVLACDGMSLEI
ncbi:MAG: MBL fold metallo-hydrolase [Verrucomicrobiae bacterium]|nr:MBL fold metallo-hydrolase [Verrucomicrobiae bacterium]